jgi:cellulose synthase/poly-beta-1,6-N-acetylglucosamine synthase-like glycosyltransferase
MSPQVALLYACRFLNERMVFGQAPEDLLGVFAQRLRWAMGALQVGAKGSFTGCLNTAQHTT